MSRRGVAAVVPSAASAVSVPSAVPGRAAVRALVAAGLVLAALLLTASAASGHAALRESSPPDGAQLDAAPAEVALTFNEPVTVPTSGLRVYDAEARRIDLGDEDRGPAETVRVGLPADLPDGGYVAVYRVTSADSHPIGGVVGFTVGTGQAVDADTVVGLFGGATGTLATSVGSVLRALGYAATLLAAGAVAFAAWVARRPADRARAWRVGRGAAAVGVVVAVLALPVQGGAVAGVGIVEALAPRVLADVLASSFGTGTVVRVAALAALLVAWRPPRPTLALPSTPATPAPSPSAGGAGLAGAVPLLLGAVAAASFALDGHQRTVEPVWLVAGADVVHLLAAAIWLGGLVLLTLTVRRPVDGDAVAAAGLVRRFSEIALLAVVALGFAGVAMAVPLVGSLGALTSTGYGTTLLVKLGLVVPVLVVAAYNRQRLVPAVRLAAVPAGAGVDPAGGTSSAGGAPSSTGGASSAGGATTPAEAAVPAALDPERRQAIVAGGWRQLRRTLLVETVVVLLVLGVTAVLVTQRPAAEEAGLRGLYTTTAALGDGLSIDVVVDPNRVGRNQIHVYVLDATLRPAAEVADLRLELTYLPEDIGPIPIEPFFAGTGHWTASTEALAFAGDWELRIVAGVGRFTEHVTTVTVPVAR